MAKNTTIQPAQVREVLGKHLLTDGFDMVLDLEESKGAYLHDSKSGKNIWTSLLSLLLTLWE